MARQIVRRLGVLVLEVGRSEILRLDGYSVDGGWREASDRVPVDAGLDRSNLDVVHADDVLMITVARQPRYHGAGGGHVRRLDSGRAQSDVFANHHRASSVARRSPRMRHRTYAYPVRLYRASLRSNRIASSENREIEPKRRRGSAIGCFARALRSMVPNSTSDF